MHRIGSVAAAAIAVFAVVIAPAYSESPNDQAVLSGLSEVKVAFDLTNGDGKALLTQLNVIDETRQSLMKQGVKPQFVLAFRGPATKLVQTDQSQIKAEDRSRRHLASDFSIIISNAGSLNTGTNRIRKLRH